LPGLEAYKQYLQTVTQNPLSFQSTHLLQLISAFAPVLLEHMADEIPTLLSLSRYGDALPLKQTLEAEAKQASRHQTITGGTPFFFRNLDTEFEGGLWRQWPSIPSLVWWVLLRTAGRWNSGWWRFSSCDEQGRLKPLTFIAEENTASAKF
jgi:hypothetical protein